MTGIIDKGDEELSESAIFMFGGGVRVWMKLEPTQ